MKISFSNFLGQSPVWYKQLILLFLIINPILFFTIGGTATAWIVIAQFIFTLAMALKCYPLQSGGLLAVEVLALGLASVDQSFSEVAANLEVILLLIFMVAGIYFMKPLLMYVFGKVFVNVKSKLWLSVIFVFMGAVLSAFLDALTVTAVIIAVCIGFYEVYHKIHSMPESDFNDDGVLDRKELSGENLEQFKAFLRSLVMHGVVGTALGGVATIVGEPQNLLIGTVMGWDFVEFFLRTAPVSIPVLFAGLFTTIFLEKTKTFGHGQKMPNVVRQILESYLKEEDKKRTSSDIYALSVMLVAAILLIAGLALHVAPVGFIGLGIIIFVTAFTGITKENQIGKAFEEALPFAALLVVFFVIVAMIHEQHLFQPVIDWALSMNPNDQPAIFYAANGLLSAISDNVFVATVYIGEVNNAFESGLITQEQFDKLAIAINTGTNLPSVATPNGQAAFLFLLTSALAPLIGLSYMRMVKMALPYTIVLGGVGLLCVMYLL